VFLCPVVGICGCEPRRAQVWWSVGSWLRIPTQIDTHSACKSTLVPIEIGTCSEANRHPYLG
jgi:hypothetical protein